MNAIVDEVSCFFVVVVKNKTKKTNTKVRSSIHTILRSSRDETIDVDKVVNKAKESSSSSSSSSNSNGGGK